MIEDPILAEGAGLAVRTAAEMLVGVSRAVTEGTSPIGPSEYRGLHEIGFGDAYKFANPNEKVPLAFFGYVENTIAAAGPVVDGVGTLSLDARNVLMLRIVPADGSDPIELPVQGVPVVAMRAPLQKARADWDTVESPSLTIVLPDPIRALVLDAKKRGIGVTATPLFFQDALYCGYSLGLAAPIRVQDPRGSGSLVEATARYRIDVTAAAGFLFPYELADEREDTAKLKETITSRLSAEEPSDVIDDFESRYLASAMIASYCKGRRMVERKTGRPG